LNKDNYLIAAMIAITGAPRARWFTLIDNIRSRLISEF